MSVIRVFNGTTLFNRRATATVIQDAQGVVQKVAVMFEAEGIAHLAGEVSEVVIERGAGGIYRSTEDGQPGTLESNPLEDMIPSECKGLLENLKT